MKGGVCFFADCKYQQSLTAPLTMNNVHCQFMLPNQLFLFFFKLDLIA